MCKIFGPNSGRVNFLTNLNCGSELYLLIGSIPLVWSTEKLCRSRNYVNFLDGGGRVQKKESALYLHLLTATAIFMCQQERWGALGERRRWRAYADMAALVRRRPVPAGQATSGPVPALRPMALCNGQAVLIYRDYKETLPKAQRWVHITSSQFLYLDQITISESPLTIINLKIWTKTSASQINLNLKSWPNLASESRISAKGITYSSVEFFVSDQLAPTSAKDILIYKSSYQTLQASRDDFVDLADWHHYC